MSKKISELPDAALPITSGVKFEAVQGGVNVKVDADDMPGSGAAGVTSVTGTTNRITSTGGTTPVIDISATYDATVQAVADAKVADAINNGTTTIAPSQNAVFDALALKQALANTAVALTDAASMDLTAIKHTLTTSSATRTFTISYTGDDISLRITLNAVTSVLTFPAGALCISEGTESGDNTCTLSGVSGDKYAIAIKHWGSSQYTVVCKREGQ